jgi:hypothetical protein
MVANILTTQNNFKVGKCEITSNPALAARFDVTSIPSIFLYRDNTVWKYEGPLYGESVVNFATVGYKKQKSIPWYSSPMGPMGMSKGTLIHIGISLTKLLPSLTAYFGLPEWIGMK